MIPFAIYRDFIPGKSLSVKIRDVQGNQRNVLLATHIYDRLELKVYDMLTPLIPFESQQFIQNCKAKTASDLIASLLSTSDMLGVTHYDLLKDRKDRIKLTKLAGWPKVFADINKLIDDFSNAAKRGSIDIQEEPSRRQWNDFIAETVESVLTGVQRFVIRNATAATQEVLHECQVIAVDLAKTAKKKEGRR